MCDVHSSLSLTHTGLRRCTYAGTTHRSRNICAQERSMETPRDRSCCKCMKAAYFAHCHFKRESVLRPPVKWGQKRIRCNIQRQKCSSNLLSELFLRDFDLYVVVVVDGENSGFMIASLLLASFSSSSSYKQLLNARSFLMGLENFKSVLLLVCPGRENVHMHTHCTHIIKESDVCRCLQFYSFSWDGR